MPNPLRIEKFSDEIRTVRGRGQLPPRDQPVHGEALNAQLAAAVAHATQARGNRNPALPEPPDGTQIFIKGATTASGETLLDSAQLKGLKLEVVEERRDGLVVALSADPHAARLGKAVEDFRTDARTAPTEKRPFGTRKPGVKAIFAVEEVLSPTRQLRLGDELSAIEIQLEQTYTVDVEVAAGRDLADEGVQRRAAFTEYLQAAGAVLVGNSPLLEDDYAFYRAQVSGTLLVDILDVHPWVIWVDLPPRVELQGIQLRNIDEPNLPPFTPPEADTIGVCVIDGGMATAHPLLEVAASGQVHRSFIPGLPGTGDAGPNGHGTAVASVAALGSLRRAILSGESVTPIRIGLARILDDNALLPSTVNVKSVLPTIVDTIRAEDDIFIFNHSICSRAQFNPARMSIWAETIDRAVYDEGGEGCLFITCTGNVDDYRPTQHVFQQDLNQHGHPEHLLGIEYRLRNPAQAINSLTVGAYSPGGGPSLLDKRQAGRL